MGSGGSPLAMATRFLEGSDRYRSSEPIPILPDLRSELGVCPGETLVPPVGERFAAPVLMTDHRSLSSAWSLPLGAGAEAYRAISTGQLQGLLPFHLRPIDVVVYHGSRRDLVLRRVSRLDAFSGYPVRT